MEVDAYFNSIRKSIAPTSQSSSSIGVMTQESLRLHTKPCKTREWAKKDSNTLKNNEEFAGSETGVTKCVTLSSDSVPELCADVELATVAASWATLPAAIKVSIIAMVRAAVRE